MVCRGNNSLIGYFCISYKFVYVEVFCGNQCITLVIACVETIYKKTAWMSFIDRGLSKKPASVFHVPH